MDEYDDIGDIEIGAADDANVPVDIWVTQIDAESSAADCHPERVGWYELRANNYMPRKARLGGEYSYRAVAKDRAVLVALIHKYWLPLYQTAVEVLTAMRPDKGGTAKLYYWQKDE